MPISIATPQRSLGLKLIIVCVLVMLMAIPAMFISYIAFERSGRAEDVIREVSQRYGGEHVITGPVLLAPYVSSRLDGAGLETGFYAVFADKGQARFADMKTAIRKRSLFKVPTYEARGELTASFGAITQDFKTGDASVQWDKARIIVGLSDARGLSEDVVLTLADGRVRHFEPEDFTAQPDGLAAAELSAAYARRDYPASQRGGKHIAAPPPPLRRYGGLNSGQGQTYLSVKAGDLVKQIEAFDVKVNMALTGAKRFGVTPFAKSTRVFLSSDWADPGFSGGFPPREREITKDGFSAQWSVPYLRRGIRAHGKAHQLGALAESNKVMSVNLASTLSPYQTVNRSLKYSVLFIGLVFLAYFLFEVIVGVRVHPAQYILIGLAQSIFYLLLLAFSERIGFGAAFAISAGCTIGATAGYAGAVFGGREYIYRAGSVFLLVYGLLYCLMRVQDFALMIGALASFLAVALTMYLTRHIDWYGLSASGAAHAPQRAIKKGIGGSDKMP